MGCRVTSLLFMVVLVQNAGVNLGRRLKALLQRGRTWPRQRCENQRTEDGKIPQESTDFYMGVSENG